jgi:hypothetical protein
MLQVLQVYAPNVSSILVVCYNCLFHLFQSYVVVDNVTQSYICMVPLQ